ncbi:DUF2256 domain-containing protein [Henriciella mobilis]|nr:DUF2256 domain-containing protein [Henriciella mobilis]RIJ14868.1 DUF2256 domain-containing protein [Henriciella mobilis]RIJ21823.1 DUF2256 domain-containing protein [Henriciella mobilis]
MARRRHGRPAKGVGRAGKGQLPEKTCAACGRPFEWRKKWEKVWNEVKFCSDRCRKRGDSTPKT